MKIVKLNENESTVGKEEYDLRPYEQAWREDFPNSIEAPKPEYPNWAKVVGFED